MKAVLISIQPKWVEKIANREKTIEVRKTAPKQVPFKAYIYCTKDKYEWLYRVDNNGYGKPQSWHGKVIGEFICDNVIEFESGFHDDNTTEELRRVWYDEDDGERDAELFAEDGEPNYLCTKACLTWYELKEYVGIGDRTFYGLHISNLKIYDKPKELSEFYITCKEKSCQMCDAEREYDVCAFGRKKPITRAPQSWQYVEEL